jgi:hypothetical protein
LLNFGVGDEAEDKAAFIFEFLKPSQLSSFIFLSFEKACPEHSRKGRKERFNRKEPSAAEPQPKEVEYHHGGHERSKNIF